MKNGLKKVRNGNVLIKEVNIFRISENVEDKKGLVYMVKFL